MARLDDGGLWLHGENAGERGPCELERVGANREVSRVAGEGAELTEATNAASTGACAERESEGVQLKAQLGEGSE